MKKILILLAALIAVTAICVVMLNRSHAASTAYQTVPESITPPQDSRETPNASASVQSDTSTENADTVIPNTPEAMASAPVSTSGVSTPGTQVAMEPLPAGQPAEIGAASAPATQVAMASVQESTASSSIGLAAFEKASKENRYLYLFCSDNDSPATLDAKNVFESKVSKMGDGVQWAYMDKNQDSEKMALAQFRISRAPVPIIVAIAPNGAVTGAFYGDKLKDPNLEEAIAGQGEQQSMRALQQGKLVLACMQNAATKSNDLAMQGVNDFKADARFNEVTEIVTLDPGNETDQKFLAKLGIEPQMEEATTAFLAPPRALLKTYTGAVTKDTLVETITTASKGGCGAGKCAPGACGPKVPKIN